MDQYRVIITPVAGEEITSIHDWIRKDAPDTAAKVILRILDALEPLKMFPHRTVVAIQSADLKHPVRSLPVPPYVILFRVLDDDKIVRVLHVRHGAQQPPDDL
jgi:plasmid stabilization system protein ParE